jgi:hypothetical protein
LAGLSGETAELDDLQTERLELGQELVERLLAADRPVQDRLDGFGGGCQLLELEQHRVADAALDPDLIVRRHARPRFPPDSGLMSPPTIPVAADAVITRTV